MWCLLFQFKMEPIISSATKNVLAYQKEVGYGARHLKQAEIIHTTKKLIQERSKNKTSKKTK